MRLLSDSESPDARLRPKLRRTPDARRAALAIRASREPIELHHVSSSSMSFVAHPSAHVQNFATCMWTCACWNRKAWAGRLTRASRRLS